MKIKRLGHHKGTTAGDTIVEVLIAMAVISMVLAGAFLVASRSTKALRDSEEHAQALQYLQGQVELLRAAASKHGGLPSSLSVPFCLDQTSYHQPANGNSNCLLGSRYSVAIVQSPSSPPGANTTTFDLTASWPALSGTTGRVNLSYKVAVAP